jgi:hypothetical protein
VSATLNAIVVGLPAVLLSLWVLAQDGELGGWNRNRLAR